VSEPPYDLIATGRIGVDLYPLQSERTLAQVETFAKSLGGSATNVAVAAARLGCSAALISKVGADGFGEYLREQLRGYGVEDRWLGVDERLRTPIVFCEIFPPDHFPILFYRQPSAPDLQIEASELDMAEIARARVFWSTGTGLCEEPSRSAVLAALQARSASAAPWQETIHDLDYRPAFWESEGEARSWTRSALAHVTIAVGNREEAYVATGEDDPRRAARALVELGVHTAIVKRGPEGVYALTREGEEHEIAPIELTVVNGLGAGDAFGGALCAGVVGGWGLRRTLLAANAAGALVASRLACAPDMPTREELEELLEASLA
jgi:5-dehydro-2-deoxygluconokinase